MRAFHGYKTTLRKLNTLQSSVHELWPQVERRSTMAVDEVVGTAGPVDSMAIGVDEEDGEEINAAAMEICVHLGMEMRVEDGTAVAGEPGVEKVVEEAHVGRVVAQAAAGSIEVSRGTPWSG